MRSEKVLVLWAFRRFDRQRQDERTDRKNRSVETYQRKCAEG